MYQFCNRKRKREDEENGEKFTNPDQNQDKKVKKDEIYFTQEISELSDFTSIDSKNISFNKPDQNSISTLQSKNEQIPFNTNNTFLFKVAEFNEIQNHNENQNWKKIELEFEEIQEEKKPTIKLKSFALNINIKKQLLSNCSSFHSKNNSNYNSSSHYSFSSSSHDEYYPYEIGEIIDNEYLVSYYLFLFLIIFFIGS